MNKKSDPEIASDIGACIFKYEQKYKTTTSYNLVTDLMFFKEPPRNNTTAKTVTTITPRSPLSLGDTG
jgi:hypothetical protein